MSNIALVTDSTSDIPFEVAEQQDIKILPLKVVFEDKEYLDRIEIQPEEFYKMLAQCTTTLPSTSQPSPADFIELYADLLKTYDDVISIHLSSGLSGTVNAARLAGERFKGKVHVVDSKTISLGIGMIVLEAANSIRAGLTVGEVLQRIQEARDNTETLFTLDTLEYLRKGGRIGKVSGAIGSMLSIKPVVRVDEEGIYTSYGKVRTQEQALKSLEKAVVQLAKGREVAKIMVAHGAGHAAASRLKERVEKLFNLEISLYTEVGPVIGVHTGPGTIGLVALYK